MIHVLTCHLISVLCFSSSYRTLESSPHLSPSPPSHSSDNQIGKSSFNTRCLLQIWFCLLAPSFWLLGMTCSQSAAHVPVWPQQEQQPSFLWQEITNIHAWKSSWTLEHKDIFLLNVSGLSISRLPQQTLFLSQMSFLPWGVPSPQLKFPRHCPTPIHLCFITPSPAYNSFIALFTLSYYFIFAYRLFLECIEGIFIIPLLHIQSLEPHLAHSRRLMARFGCYVTRSVTSALRWRLTVKWVKADDLEWANAFPSPLNPAENVP